MPSFGKRRMELFIMNNEVGEIQASSEWRSMDMDGPNESVGTGSRK